MKRCVIDLAGVCVCLAALAVAVLYENQVRGQEYVVAGAGLLMAAFIFAELYSRLKPREGRLQEKGLPSGTGRITEAVLLNEEDTELTSWDLYGRTALVIGRDVRENQVDIDLGSGPYASMVEVEHAVLNYSAGKWYVEDLGSANGLQVKKAGDGRVYRLSPDTPCRLEQGDCLYIGLNRLLFR